MSSPRPLPLVAALKLTNFQALRFRQEELVSQVSGQTTGAQTTKSDWVESDLPAQAASVIEAQHSALKKIKDAFDQAAKDNLLDFALDTPINRRLAGEIAAALALAERAP